METIQKMIETVGLGDNPLLFWVIAAVALIVAIVILRSILHIIMIFVIVGLIALGVGYVTEYDFSEVPIPTLEADKPTTELEDNTSNTSDDANHIEKIEIDTSFIKDLPDHEDIGQTLDDIATLDDLTVPTTIDTSFLDRLKEMMNNAVKYIEKL